jgi:NADPH-dependent ferric siderophore reductase
VSVVSAQQGRVATSVPFSRYVSEARKPRQAVVVSVEALVGQFRSIVLGGPGLASYQTQPGWYLGLRVDPAASWRRSWRHYTVRDLPEPGLVELHLMAHGLGPGGRWVADVAPGDEVALQGVAAGPTPAEGSSRLIMIGDDPAIPTMAAVAETFRLRSKAIVSLARPEHAGLLPFEDVTTFRYDRERPGGLSEALADEVRDPDVGATYVCLGEMALVGAARQVLVDVGVPRRRVLAKSYWSPERKGM